MFKYYQLQRYVFFENMAALMQKKVSQKNENNLA